MDKFQYSSSSSLLFLSSLSLSLSARSLSSVSLCVARKISPSLLSYLAIEVIVASQSIAILCVPKSVAFFLVPESVAFLLVPSSSPSSLPSSSFFITVVSPSLPLQLQSLMETLNSTEPHYIRCVTNNVLKPAIFENLNIIQQLRCGGVLEAIRISCAGYPTRGTFYEFLNQFGVLAPEVLDGNYDDKVACQMILD
ncbi:uncharacterized protein DS421_13g423830 [Arachis hypogaea]|nr:uncharacterized protein DS421_13g423830 [Arachis hypogaea]